MDALVSSRRLPQSDRRADQLGLGLLKLSAFGANHHPGVVREHRLEVSQHPRLGIDRPSDINTLDSVRNVQTYVIRL